MMNWKGFGRKWSRTNCKAEENHKKTSIRIASAMVKIQTKYLLNISPKHSCYTRLPRVGCFDVNKVREMKLMTLYQMMDTYLVNVWG
jgi:hypothetical protein